MHISKWHLFLKRAIAILNKNVTILTKDNITSHINKKQAQYFGIPEQEFKYAIGDRVKLKAMATPDGRERSSIPGFKRSLGKNDG